MSAGGKCQKDIKVIPNSMEKYISFQVSKLRFLDSYQLMPNSLETLIDNLAQEGLKHFKTSLNEGKTPKRPKEKKLVPTLHDKEDYILHYETLKLYLKLGLKVKKIHKIIEFHQSTWLKTYIDFNAKKRSQAKNDFEKDFYKLMCNRYVLT
jgi:hypothetical protein